MNQKESYYNAITNVLKEDKVKFVPNETVVKSVITSEQKTRILTIIIAGFNKGSIELKDTPNNKAKLADPVKMETYARQTLKNWLDKDLRLNGNVPFEFKKPGSRAGQGDKVLKNLKALQSTFQPGTKQYDIVSAKVEARRQEVLASKAKSKKEVDYSLIDPELKKQLGIK